MKNENAAVASAAHPEQPSRNNEKVTDHQTGVNLSGLWRDLLGDQAPSALLEIAARLYGSEAVAKAIIDLSRSPHARQYTSDKSLFLALVRTRRQCALLMAGEVA